MEKICRFVDCLAKFGTKEERRIHYERKHYGNFDFCPYCTVAVWRFNNICSSNLRTHMEGAHGHINIESELAEHQRERENGRIPRFVATAPTAKQEYYSPLLESIPGQRSYMCPKCNQQFRTESDRRIHAEQAHKDDYDFCPYCPYIYDKPNDGCSPSLKSHIGRRHNGVNCENAFAEHERERSNGRIPRFVPTAPDAKQQYYDIGLDNQAGPSEDRRQEAPSDPPSNANIPGTSQNQ